VTRCLQAQFYSRLPPHQLMNGPTNWDALELPILGKDAHWDAISWAHLALWCDPAVGNHLQSETLEQQHQIARSTRHAFWGRAHQFGRSTRDSLATDNSARRLAWATGTWYGIARRHSQDMALPARAGVARPIAGGWLTVVCFLPLFLFSIAFLFALH
jgi:hypothetical protein